MKINIYTYLLLIPLLVACKSRKETQLDNTKSVVAENIDMNIVEVTPKPPYRKSATKHFDLIHTELNLSFNYEKQHVIGNAKLKLKPHFYKQNTLVLDAKGFEIKSVYLLSSENELDLPDPLKFENTGLKLKIDLTQFYTKRDTLNVVVNYVAKPNDIKRKGSKAISQAKGLYFINPLGKIAGKPTQIWTQGETESSSCWFPTLDAPNQKTSLDISLTVRDSFKTLSNGMLVSKSIEGKGMRTDRWVQEKKQAPYLTMITVGKFAEVKDKWRDIEVNYLVEPHFKNQARMVFGKTPEMIEFFSQKLGVDYPWDKYHQVVVRDFVSGAMENTGAVVFMEGMQHDARTHIDKPHEDIVAHELFHHWFGDLVTCESWSNLALNESFATYGEVLWMEYKYGKAAGEYHRFLDKKAYLAEAKFKEVPIARFFYKKQESLFDRHTYQKGGLVLNMLRNLVGDDAFFASLKKYLTDNKYQSAEIADLRMAFEDVTGRDMTVFFNRWFFQKSHSFIELLHSYNPIEKEYTLKLRASEKLNIPVKVVAHYKNRTVEHKIYANKMRKTLKFKSDTEPLWVSFDPGMNLLAEYFDSLPFKQWQYKALQAPSALDRFVAVNNFDKHIDMHTAEVFTSLDYALHDKVWYVRKAGLIALNNTEIDAIEIKHFEKEIENLAKYDKNSKVRAAAIKLLAKIAPMSHQFYQSLNDSSYIVAGNALLNYAKVNEADGVKIAKANTGLYKSNNYLLRQSYKVLVSYSKEDEGFLFQNKIEKLPGYYSYMKLYGIYIANTQYKYADNGVDYLLKIFADKTNKQKSDFAKYVLLKTKTDIAKKLIDLESFMKVARYTEEGLKIANQQKVDYAKLIEKIDEYL